MIIGVLGLGTMGLTIALVFAQSGFKVLCTDVCRKKLESALGRMRAIQKTLIRHNVLTQAEATDALSRINLTSDLAEFAHVDVISEAILENLRAKKNIFKEISRRCRPTTIFTSNTSALSISNIAQEVTYPERFAGMHFVNPAHIMGAVEVIRGRETSDVTFNLVRDLVIKIGKCPVLVQEDEPGFILNRLQFALFRQALVLVADRTASYELIDRIVRDDLAAHWVLYGLLTTKDLEQLAVFQRMGNSPFRHLSNTKEVPTWFYKIVEDGNRGLKTKSGIYDDYSSIDEDDIIADRDEKLLRLQKIKSSSINKRDFVLKRKKRRCLVGCDKEEVLNLLRLALLREAVDLVERGIARREDIDMVVRKGLAPRWALYGPFRIADFGGLDVFRTICKNLFPHLSKIETVPAWVEALVG